MPAYRQPICHARISIRSRRLKAALFVSTAFCGFAIAMPAPISAQSATQNSTGQYAFSIAPQSLSSAMVAFQSVTGISVLADASVPQNVNSPGVSGSLTAENALAQMLAGTGLSYSISANTARIINPSTDSSAATVDGAIALDTIDVSGANSGAQAASGSGYQGTPDWVYDTPAGVSVISREAIQSGAARNARDLLDNVAGVYANRAEAQNPGIAVNIRGLQDNDRVVTMIDGARQSFQRGGHGVTQRTYVDTAFVRGIEVEKSSTSGVGSLGSLGGSVNFRTILAEDIIAPSENAGAEVNTTTGTNGYYFDGSIATAFRNDWLAITGGISRKNIGPYDIGKNGTVRNQASTTDGQTMLFSGQQVLSGLLKAEAQINEDMKLTLGWMRNNSDFSTGNYSSLLGGILLESKQTVVNQTYTAAFDWKPADDLIDFKARFYYNGVDNDDYGVVIDGVPRNFTMATLGGSIENTSRFDTELGSLSFNYGAEAFRDVGKSTVPSYIIDGVDMAQFWNGGTPGGTRDVAGGFVSAKLEHSNWLTVQGGLRYDWYGVNGSTTIYGNQTVIYHPPSNCIYELAGICYVYGTPERWETVPPQPHEVQIDRSQGALLPTFTVAAKPYEWLQPFVKYSKSFRPPTVMELFLASGRTNDGINTWAPNPYLNPERGDTWELGFNIAQDGLFSQDDRLRVKVVGFYREVDDYIALGRIYNDETDRPYNSPVNLDGTSRMKGLEIEANYDARTWYIGGTLTYNKADWAKYYRYQGGTDKIGPNTAVIFVQPEMRVSLDGGVRLFDEKLTLGGRITHVGESEPTIGTLQQNYQLPEYRIYDLYGSYALNDNAKLRFNISNLTDVAYVSALGADYYAMPGRTVTGGFQLKF